MTPDPLDLDAIEALTDAATPEPWVVNKSATYWDWRVQGDVPIAHIPGVIDYGTDGEEGNYPTVSDADAAFIAVARMAVPALIAEVRTLRAEVARLRSVGEDDIATWAEYVTGKKWAPVDAVASPEG